MVAILNQITERKLAFYGVKSGSNLQKKDRTRTRQKERKKKQI